MKKTLRFSLVLLLTVLLVPFTSCKKDDPDPDVISSFTFKVDAADFKKVAFTNESQNFSALSWNFGDGSAVSTETNPVHVYANIGEYNVTLTATSLNGKVTDVYTTKVTIADPNQMLTILVGETSKTWKLLRDVSTGRYPLEVGPIARNEIWWAVGRNNDELAIRTCMLNDEWTFGRDGSMVFNDHGDYWAEGSVYPDGSNNMCASTNEPMLNKDGVDVSAWASGNHTFVLTPGATPTLETVGNGAYIGLSKVGTDLEHMVPQPSVKYNVIALTEGTTDTLIVEAEYKFNAADPGPGGYWRFVLVHYDNPADEPPIPGNQPAASFSTSIDGLTVSFTNNSNFANSYSWAFGDGSTSTEENPTHTYAEDGFYTVSLTAVNDLGTATATQNILLSTTALTDELLQGAPWKVSLMDKAISVGPGIGDGGWWQTPLSFLDGSQVGTGDDWSCIVDDEFTFAAGGVYTYDTKGSTRNDGYFGGTNGCISDADIAASGNGAFFGSALGADAHTYTFTPATADSRPIIELTNSATRAAFIGFMKGYYGGENVDGANPPNGGNSVNRYEVVGYAKSSTKEYLLISVDISVDHNGSAAWNAILER